jgi:hypothetical protein
LDCASGHPANLTEVRTPQDTYVGYMPSNTTLLFHQWTFKAYYLCQTFLEVVRVLDRSDITIKDYCCSFYILKELITSMQLGRKCH